MRRPVVAQVAWNRIQSVDIYSTMKVFMTSEMSLADRLAANRANGRVIASAEALHAARRIQTWSDLGVARHVSLLWLSLGFYPTLFGKHRPSGR